MPPRTPRQACPRGRRPGASSASRSISGLPPPGMLLPTRANSWPSFRRRGTPPRAQICMPYRSTPWWNTWPGSATQATLLSVPLTAELLAHLNVAAEGDPTADRNLSSGGRLEWPLIWRAAWLGKLSQERRRSLELLLPKAIVQASNVAGGVVDAGLLTRMRTDLNQLQGLLDAKIDQLTSSEYVRANAVSARVEGDGQDPGPHRRGQVHGDRPALDPRTSRRCRTWSRT